MMDIKTLATLEWVEKQLKRCQHTAVVLEHSIQDYLTWLETSGLSQSTKKKYKRSLEHFLSFIKLRRYTWEEIFTPATLTRFVKISGVTHTAAVSGLSRYLYKQGRISEPIRSKKPQPPLPTIYRDYFIYQQKYQNASDRDIKQSQRVLRPFDRYLKRHRIRLEALKIEHIDEFRTREFKGFSVNTRRIYRSRLRGFLRYLYYERRILKKDLAPLVTGAAMFAQNKPPKFLRPDEISRLFAGLKYNTATDLRAAAMVHLAYFLGMRPCEICLLRLDDIHFGKEVICLRHRKNDCPAVLPLPEKVIKVIAAYLIGGRAKSEHRTLFLTLRPPYRPMNPNTVAFCIKKRMKAVGLHGTAYWLRHTYSQNLLQSGATIYELKEMLGHRNIESTRKYLHIHTKLMREVLFDEAF